MQSLFESFKTKVPRWSYYDIEIDPARLFSQFNGDAHQNCREFINKHFRNGGKAVALRIPFDKEYEKEGKHEHTVVLYLLGLLFQEAFFSEIKKDLDMLRINTTGWYNRYDYMYTWYLTCLYHDTASCVEEAEGQTFPCCNHCIVRGKNPYTNKTVFRQKKPRYSKETIKNYCFYRISNGKRDHGIHGGMMLYNKLCSNFKQMTRDHKWEDNSVCMRNGLSLRREHLDHFAYVADAIICHNMWTVQETDVKGVEKYKKYRLDELIIHSEVDKLSINEYPLQFMLCLLDTIEPVKRFEQLTAQEVLENISIEQLDGGIQIAWTEKIKQQPEFWKWIENISTVKDWMQVDVSSCRQEDTWCYVTINIR